MITIKEKCFECNGIGDIHEVILPPNDPQEWWEPCRDCVGKGFIKKPLIDYLTNKIKTLVFYIKCIPNRLKYEKLKEDNQILF